MKNFDPLFIAELQKENAHLAILAELRFSATWRYTSAEIDQYYGGDKYSTEVLKLGNISFAPGMGVQRLTLQLGAADGIWPAIIRTEDIRWREVTILAVALNGYGGILAPGPGWHSVVMDYDCGQDWLKLSLATELILWEQQTVRKYSSSCPWVVGEDECGYTGGQDCDQTYDRCQELGNTDNFGGFRWLPDIAEKEEWWGRVPK